MIGRLDRYVGKTVIGSYVACLVFLTFLMVVFETLRNVGAYSRGAAMRDLSTLELIWTIVRYHTLNLPFLFVNVAPFVTVIACMFAVARLMTQNEIVPMLFTGRSMFRVLLPALATALVSAAAMGATWELVLPRLVEPRDRLMNLLESGEERLWQDSVMLRPGGNTRAVLYCGRYWPTRQRMETVRLYDKGGGPADARLVEADAASWDPAAQDWRLENGTVQIASRRHPIELLGAGSATPELIVRLGKSQREVNDLSYAELAELRESKPQRRDYVIGFHRHFTFPLANLVLMFLALPFAVSFERGRRIERVIFAIAICACYLVADLTCQNAGYRGWMHPLVAAWAPTIAFGSASLVFVGSMRT